MTHAIFELLVFANGLTFGVVLTAILKRRLDNERINQALNTVGITRKEHLKLDGQVAALQQTVAHNCNRLAFLEKSHSEIDRL